MIKRVWVSSLLLMGAVGCDDQQSGGLTVGTPQGAGDCTLSLDGIAGTEWLYLRANPDKSESPDIKTRLKFVSEGGAIHAKYNVGSLSDMYDYTCAVEGDEMVCKQQPNVVEWCKAMIAAGDECTAEALKAQEPALSDKEIEDGIKAANADFASAKSRNYEKGFKQQYNNMGNKLRGVLYVKVDARKCRLRVQDMYRFYYNGKWGEDSNPAGINPFVKNDQGELLWDHCDNPLDLVDLKSAEYPSDPANVKNVTQHAVNEPVHYWFLSGDYAAPEEGCTYSYNTWLNYKPDQQNLKPEEIAGKGNKKELRWHFTKTYTEASGPGEAEVVTMNVVKTCAGKEAVKTTACNAVVVK